jgi:hypothetical protein
VVLLRVSRHILENYYATTASIQAPSNSLSTYQPYIGQPSYWQRHKTNHKAKYTHSDFSLSVNNVRGKSQNVKYIAKGYNVLFNIFMFCKQQVYE